ncbi:hypothetical protein IJT17_03940 [bacterium]|nr:hypothetical protein [bacterium]
MIKKTLISAMLLLSLASPAYADWTVHKNADLAKQGAYGWTVSLPDTWMQLPDVKPAWPEGAGYTAPGGQTYITIAKSPRPTETEQAQLTGRGFSKSQRQVKSYNMLEFTKQTGAQTERLLYLSTPRGEYRIFMCFDGSSQEDMNKILKSFTFINDPQAKADAPWPVSSGPEQTFTIACPHDCHIDMQSSAFTVTQNGKTIMQGKLYENSDPPAQSFRGMARQLGMHFKPDGQEPAKFTPYEIGSVTAYEVMGQQANQNYYGPLIYVPLYHSKWKVLECYLTDQDSAQIFFRIVNTIKPQKTAAK